MLKNHNIAEFMDKLSSKDIPVGGGSASALSGLLAAGLLKMAVNHSLANASLSAHREVLQDNFVRLDRLSRELTRLIDRDAEVLAQLFEVFSEETAGETEPHQPNPLRGQCKKAAALETAAKVPLQTAAACLETLEIARSIATIVEENLKSELMTAVICGHAGATGALMSTAANLGHLSDGNLVISLKKEIRAANFKADELKEKTENLIFRDYPFDVFLS